MLMVVGLLLSAVLFGAAGVLYIIAFGTRCLARSLTSTGAAFQNLAIIGLRFDGYLCVAVLLLLIFF